MAGNALNDQKYHLATIQCREGQQIEHAQIDGDEGQQLQQILPAVACRLTDRCHDTHRAGQIVDALTSAHKVCQRDKRDASVVQGTVPCFF